MFSDPLFQAIVLGIVQGLAEFLPISSSGHLVVVPYLFSWPSPGLGFNVALHAGTLLGVVAYFAVDLWYLATRSVGIGVKVPGEDARARRTVALLAVGSLPAAAAGLLLEATFAGAFERPLWVAGFFVCTAALLMSAEHVRAGRARSLPDVADDARLADLRGVDTGRDETTVGWTDTVVIGSFQALALFPGISRSGSTIAAGMYRGLSRSASARWSFLLSIPAVAGATLVEVPELLAAGGAGQYGLVEVFAGMAAAAAAGYWAIRYLLRLVVRDDLTGFARYLVFLAVLVGLGYAWIGPAAGV